MKINRLTSEQLEEKYTIKSAQNIYGSFPSTHRDTTSEIKHTIIRYSISPYDITACWALRWKVPYNGELVENEAAYPSYNELLKYNPNCHDNVEYMTIMLVPIYEEGEKWIEQKTKGIPYKYFVE